jgi:hypothetical protein
MNSVPPPSPDRRSLQCPVCGSEEICYAYCSGSTRYEVCTDCEYLFANPFRVENPTTQAPSRIVPSVDQGSLSDRTSGGSSMARHSLLLDLITEYGAMARSGGVRTLLVDSCDRGFAAAATRRGFAVTSPATTGGSSEAVFRLFSAGPLGEGMQPETSAGTETFDLCIVKSRLEYESKPLEVMEQVWRHLKLDGIVAVLVPDSDHKVTGEGTPAGQYSEGNLQTLLYRSGFGSLRTAPFPRVSRNGNDRFVLGLGRKLAGGFMRPRKLSIIVPAYNEGATFPELIQSVLDKDVPGMDLEVVVVESNSTDGTREEALKLCGDPRVKLVLEDRPRGKGHAVRRAFEEVSGDIILIQDADLEYDLLDYESLLRPIVQLKTSFVLGSRHSRGIFKMRRFKDTLLVGQVINFGHYVLTTLFNVLYGQSLRDPFTMYKVFRADCIDRAEFSCDRFDFDIELVITLIQRGFKPVEIPVNYASRSFKEGKKVSFLSDPLLIFAVMLKRRLFRSRTGIRKSGS